VAIRLFLGLFFLLRDHVVGMKAFFSLVDLVATRLLFYRLETWWPPCCFDVGLQWTIRWPTSCFFCSHLEITWWSLGGFDLEL
jgi:hypothetical protein